MRGRQAAGPELVQRLVGEAAGKRRAEVILQTVAGQVGVQEGARRLGITSQRLHVLRAQALQGLLDALAPRALGRPRQVAAVTAEELAVLRAENDRLRQELTASQLREELARLLPGGGARGRKKKRRRGAARGSG